MTQFDKLDKDYNLIENKQDIKTILNSLSTNICILKDIYNPIKGQEVMPEAKADILMMNHNFNRFVGDIQEVGPDES